MVILLKNTATEKDIKTISELLENRGLGVHISHGKQATIIGVLGDKTKISDMNLELFPFVEKCIPIMKSYKLASREFRPEGSIVKVGDVEIGGNRLVMMAGPCSVESEEQIIAAAKAVKASGAHLLRGGAYKPRTSPYAFQGLEDEGYRLLNIAAKEAGLKCISEVISENQVETAGKYVDMLQVGARNMQNFRLLREIGRSKIPVLLKRGISSTIEEWLDAAEYIMSEGNYNVVLCERGIRTFETSTRNTLDISAVAVVKEKSNLPIIIDPSHAAGRSKYVPSLSMAAIAAGADGLIIEVHPEPIKAVSDAAQQLTFPEFEELCKKLKTLAKAVGREY